MMRRATVFISVLFLYASGFAQLNGKLDHLNVTHGLSNGTVLSIFQDQEGLMWFGTSDGLNSYNGYNFKHYHHDKEDSTSISSNYVTKVMEKTPDELWVATHANLNIFQKRTGRFKRIQANPLNSEALTNQTITDFARDKDEFLWVATAWGLNKLDARAPYRVVSRYYQPPGDQRGLANNHVNCLLLDGSDLWVGTNDGLSILDTKTGQFKEPITFHKGKKTLTDKIILDIIKDTEGTFWIATEYGANHYFPENDSLVRYFPDADKSGSLGAKIVRQIFEDSRKNLWFATDGAGFYQYDRARDSFIPTKKNPYKPLSLTTNAIYSIFESKDNTLWIGTYERGIHYYNHRKSLFHTYTHDPFHNSISQSSVKAVVESKFRNGLWLATASEGVNFFDLETGKFSVYKHDKNDFNSLSTSVITTLYEDDTGKLWVGTFTGGLNCYDPVKGTNINYPEMPPNQSIPKSSHIWSLYRDKLGNFWVGTLRGGLVLFQPETGKYEHFTNDPLDSTSIASNLISVMYEDSRGNFWIGNEEENGGLNLMDRDAKTFKRFVHDPNSPSTISHNFVREIFEDSQSNLWIGTSYGLNLFDYESETFTSFNHLPPLKGIINDILEDNDGYLWISTNEGLVRFDPSTYEYIDFNGSDGLQGNEFNSNAAIKLNDGRLFFGGLNGFNLFDPSEIVTKEPFPRVILTNFKLREESIEPGSSPKLERNINYTETITLQPDESTLSIEFAAINFYSPQKTRYAYRLEGLEKDWRYVGNERKASYTNLDPGRYTFYVKASNSWGEWGNDAASVNIRILPAWYETTVSKILAILIAGGAVFIFLHYRTKTLSQNKLQLQKMVSKRTAEVEELNRELANSNKSLQYINQTLVTQRNELKKTIDELKITRDRLIISEKMASLGVFTAGIAHELNNPVNYLSGGTKLLCEIIDKNKRAFDTEEYSTVLELENTMQMGVEKIADIVKSLRNYVHEDTEEFKRFNLIYCVEDALKLLKSEYKDRIIVHKELPNELYMDCLPGRINQIIVNLISNAIDAIKGEGDIYVRVSKTSQQAVLQVKDTGKGIPSNMLSKLYDPFFTTKDVGKGMGLGLYIVYGLVDMHHGRISVTSVEGKGTEFTVAFPLTQRSASTGGVSRSPVAKQV